MNDSGIIKLFFQRDNDAVKHTSDNYGGKMMRMAEQMLGSKEDAQECVNDTLLKVWDSIPPNNPDNLQAYIMRLCRNTALNMIEWKNAKKRHAEVISLTKELEDCIPGGETVDSEDSELSEVFSTFLKSISKEKRTMFVRRYWFSDSIEDIAKMFGCSQSKVKVTLHRTRKELKDYLIKEGVFYDR